MHQTNFVRQIIIVDYFFIKRGNIHTPSLFNPSRGSLYYYTKGWNLKALGCWVCAAIFGIPGLVGAYNPSAVGPAATHIYQMGWIVCFAVASTLYFVASPVLPPRGVPEAHHDDPKLFEGFAETEGYLEGDDLVEFRRDVHQGEEPASGSASIKVDEKV